MNFKKGMLALAALVVGFSSCSKDNNLDTPEVTPGKPTTVTITLDQAGVTKAHHGNATPTAAEGKIHSAKIYVFGPTSILEDIIVADVAADGLSATKTFKSTTGLHYFYAAINIPDGVLTGITKESTTTRQFREALLTAADIGAPTSTTTGFWMTNLEEAKGVELKEATESTAATVNNIEIKVGRAVAKVGVDFIPNEQKGGELSAVQYRVRQNPTKMYSVPMIDGNIWKSPYFADNTTGKVYFDSDLATAFKNTGVSGTPCTELSYAMENSNEVPRYGNASYLSIKGKFTPYEVLNADGTKGTATADGTFWRIATYKGTVGDSEVLGYNAEYYNAKPDATEYDDTTQAPVEYKEGICYYPLYIAHTNFKEKNERYAVRRNSYYWVNIIAVNGAGSNTEDGVIPDPDRELDKETWLKATIAVQDWTKVEQNGGI